MSGRSSEVVRELLDQALARSGAERIAFLQQSCGNNPPLRAEMDELLAALDQAASFLEMPAASTMTVDRPSSQMTGREIGRYTIRREIAAGGMGTVYEAIQHKPQRVVALKLMKRGLASRSALRRFEYEAQILARLRHPGIAQVYEAGVHDDVPYFAMEYIPNAATLIEFVRQRALGTRQRLELCIQICDAVHHGHQRGIIHRDLKPGNILIDSNGRPKVIDFGVARATDSDLAITTMQTDVGQLIGTLQYMSPEQCAADPHDLDIRSDVYALGVVLYELLSGQLPYELSALPIYEATRIIREQSPALPSSVDRSLRGDVETIVMKAMNKDRARRYHSAAELGDDIRRFLHNEPISARPASFAYQFRMFARRNRAVVRSAALTFVLLVCAIVIVTTFWARASHARQEKSKLANDVAALFATQLNQSVKFADNAGQKDVARHIIIAGEEYVQGKFVNEPEIEVQVLRALGLANMGIGEYRRGETYLQRSIDIGQASLGKNNLRTLDSAAALAELYRNIADYDRAEAQLRDVIAGQRSGLAVDERNPAIWNQYADMLHDLGRCAEAESLLREALDLLDRRVESPAFRAYYMIDLAGVVRDQGRHAEAERILTGSLELFHDGPGDSVVNRTHRELGRLYLMDGRLDQARQEQREALDGYDRDPLVGQDHLDRLLCIEVDALIDQAQGRLVEALKTFTLIAHRADNSFNTEQIWLAAHFHTDEAICLMKLNRFTEAEPILLKAYDTLRTRLGDPHHRTQNCIQALAELFEATGRSEDAALYRARFNAARCM